MARPKLLDDYMIQGRNGNVVTTLAGGTFTTPDGKPFMLCNETDADVTLSVMFADGSAYVNKKFRVGDNSCVLKSFVMSTPAVALFYLQ